MNHSAPSTDLIQLIPNEAFKTLVDRWHVDKNVRTLPTRLELWTLITASLFRLEGFREIEGALGVSRSTLSDALRERSSGFLQDLVTVVVRELIGVCQKASERRALRSLLAIDSTECRVHGDLLHFPGYRKSKNKTASVKLHVVWNVGREWIEEALITNGCASDLATSKLFPLKKKAFYVFDRAYTDVGFWLKIQQAGSHFVTRLKRSSRLWAVCDDKEHDGVLYDGDWFASGSVCDRLGISKQDRPKFRHIVYRDPETKKRFDFVTSNRTLSALTVAEIYKKRWSVELLFRWLKGHLGIRKFRLRTPNGVRNLLLVSVLIQLLVRVKKQREKSRQTLAELLRWVRIGSIRKTLVPYGFDGHPPTNPNQDEELTR